MLAKTAPGRITVLLNTPIELIAMYVGAKAQRAARDPADLPVAVHQLYAGASELFMEVFGESGRHTRSAIGMSTLPRGVSVEVEAVAELKP